MKQKNIVKTAIWLMVLLPLKGNSQNVLDDYVRLGLDSNIVIKQRSVQKEKAMLALSTAKSNFLPTVDFNASYTSAEGGRYSVLPIGDLMNPVYATLNQMTNSNAFPQINNTQINFLPNNFYDTRVRTALPLLNTDIIANKRIQEQKVELSQLDLEIYARELVKNIKLAYFQVIMADEQVKVLLSNREVLDQHLRLQEALLAEGKGLNVNVVKAKAELLKLDASITAAETRLENARAYFNFLLNRPLNTEINLEQIPVTMPTEKNVDQREELQLLNQSIKVQESVLTMNRNYWVPKINAFLDLGSQGTNWEVSRKSAYYMVGVSIAVPIYSGSKNKQQINQTKLDIENSYLQQEQTEQQLQLQYEQAQRSVASAAKNLENAETQLAAAKDYFALVSGVQQEGLTSQLEYIDAANQVTSAELFVSVQYQQYLASLAELERAAATYPLNLK